MDEKPSHHCLVDAGARIACTLMLASAPAAGLRAQALSHVRETPLRTPSFAAAAQGVHVARARAWQVALPDWPGSAAQAAKLAAASRRLWAENRVADPIPGTAIPGGKDFIGRSEVRKYNPAIVGADTSGRWWADETRTQSALAPQATAAGADRKGSPGHIFWVIPAFKVNYAGHFQRLTPREKFQEWAQSSYDPLGFGDTLVEAATLEYSSKDGYCGYGSGWGGYGECFGSLELDGTDSSFLGDFALTVLLHQDPRYFRLGEGSFGRRLGYAISRVFVTYSDSGRTVFYTSALSGTFIAAGLSNFYYPAQDVGARHTMTRAALDLGNTVLYNAAAEFWPDIKRKLDRVF